jgi:hypothetical protein
METFKTLLDDYDLVQLGQKLSQFIHSADGYDNRLKLTFALIDLLNEGCTLLKTIDVNDFINDIRKRVEEIESQSSVLKESYRRHFDSNNDISTILANPGDNRISTLQEGITKSLKEYDSILRAIVELRESLPLETLLKEQKQT